MNPYTRKVAAKSKKLRVIAASRPCGDCTECCTVLAVESGRVQKAAGVACDLLCAAPAAPGCSIWNARPKQCRDFYCLWRVGVGDEGDRPDRSGVVLDVPQGAARLKDVPYMIARGDLGKGREFLARVARAHVVVLDGTGWIGDAALPGKKIAIGPGDQLEKFSAAVLARGGEVGGGA